jgi:invasion protein IalB
MKFLMIKLGLSLMFLIMVSPSYAVETSSRSFDNWVLRCSSAANPMCEISQRMVNSKTKKKLLELFVTEGQEKNRFRARIIVPLGAWLRSGVSLEVGGKTAKSQGYLYCLPVGCIADLSLPSSMISAMKRANDGIISIADMKRQQIKFKISLKGFTQAINNMQQEITKLGNKGK